MKMASKKEAAKPEAKESPKPVAKTKAIEQRKAATHPKPEPKGPAPKKTPAKKEEKTSPKAEGKKGGSKDKAETKKDTDTQKVEIVEEEKSVYQPKIKPTLDMKQKAGLRTRKDIAGRRPTFLRQEWFRFQRLGEKWRKPRGMHSKMRVHMRYRGKNVRIGYRGPKDVRGLHPSGFVEVLVFNVNDLRDINPKTQAVRIGHGVGAKKRKDIVDTATKKEIRVLNRGS